jgi:hypothetical protein
VKATPDLYLLRALGDLHVLHQDLNGPFRSPETVHAASTCFTYAVAYQNGVKDLRFSVWVVQAEINARKSVSYERVKPKVVASGGISQWQSRLLEFREPMFGWCD